MRPPRLRACLVVTLASLAASGCSSVPGGRVGRVDRQRTMASSGGSRLPTETGPPGAEVVADLGEPEIGSRSEGRISGRVLDPQGKPVPSAEVRLAVGSARAGRDFRAVTDEAGGFTLHGLRPNAAYTLVAEGDVGRDTMVGRASARAPSGNVRIRLRPDDATDVTEAEQADDPFYALAPRKVERASNRREADDEDAQDEPEPAASRPARGSRRVNDADLPPAAEADPAPANPPASGPEGPADKAARAAWRRGSTPTPEASAAASQLERPGKPAAIEPKVPERPATAVDEGPNPLPPAKEHPADPAPTAPAPAPPTPAEPAPTGSAPGSSPSLDPPATPPAEPAPVETKPAEPAATPDPAPSGSSASIPAEAAPRRRATWAEVASSDSDARTASALPLSTRRVPARQVEPPAEPPRGRAGLLSLKGRDRDAGDASPTIAAATCKFDPKTQRIADFQLPNLDGKPVRLRDLDADFILLDFWGTWCGPCRESIPHLVELQNRYGDRALRVVGIATEHDGSPMERARRVETVAKNLGVNYPLLLSEADGKSCPLQQALHVQHYPTMVLIDRTGQILWRGTGAEGMTLARLDRVIAARADASVLRR